jgi:hypothetical protein
MIKNKKLWEDFEIELIKNEKIDYKKNFKIFNELYKLAKSLNKFKFDYLEDIEYDIKYALVINGVRKNEVRKKWKQLNFSKK